MKTIPDIPRSLIGGSGNGGTVVASEGRAIWVLLLGSMLCCCGSGSDSKSADRISGKDAEAGRSYDTASLITLRQEKDGALRGESSPIPEAEREVFPGLRYYPPNPAYAFALRLERFPAPEPVQIGATGGELRPMSRLGRFTFEIDGRLCTLVAYTSTAHPENLFIPFADVTNGEETYEGGRYLDLEQHEGDLLYQLDFNLAYSPYCAYNESYSCPVVPRENVLPVAIRAGELAPAKRE